MASKKYRTVAEASYIPEGQYIRDLSAEDLRARLATLMPVVWKRVATIKKSGLDPVAELPPLSYRGKSRAELEHIFFQQRYWLTNRMTSSVKGIRALARQTAKNLGISVNKYKDLTKDQIRGLFETFHKIQEIREDWFTGKYSAKYLKTVRREYLKNPNGDINDIVKKLQKVYEDEQGKNNRIYQNESFTELSR